jgi:hypothetical protein
VFGSASATGIKKPPLSFGGWPITSVGVKCSISPLRQAQGSKCTVWLLLGICIRVKLERVKGEVANLN